MLDFLQEIYQHFPHLFFDFATLLKQMSCFNLLKQQFIFFELNSCLKYQCLS